MSVTGRKSLLADKDGGGSTSFPSDVILYHELSHAFHFATGALIPSRWPKPTKTTCATRTPPLPHRNTASHNGGCGGAPPPPCCIIASLSTGSPYSTEVQRFRLFREHTLRGSMVGNDFFEQFHYRYYGFSPEVTRLIGQKSNMRPLIKGHFVVPLLAGVELLMHYAQKEWSRLGAIPCPKREADGMSEFYETDFDELASYLKLAKDFDDDLVLMLADAKGEEFSGVSRSAQAYQQRDNSRRIHIGIGPSSEWWNSWRVRIAAFGAMRAPTSNPKSATRSPLGLGKCPFRGTARFLATETE